MAAWDISAAISSLRSLLGDNSTDKFEFKTNVYPTPDNVTTRFFTGSTRLVSGSLQVYAAGTLVPSGAPSGIIDIDTEKGSFELARAPSGHIELQASFYYQWFKDTELTEFLTAAANMVGYETVTDGALPILARGALLDFACYYAYMKKAAEFAEFITASAGGYTVDQGKAHPNWRSLAETALKAGKEKLDVAAEDPLGAGGTPQMRFITYRVQRWQGP